jgi:hypothetical protein
MCRWWELTGSDPAFPVDTYNHSGCWCLRLMTLECSLCTGNRLSSSRPGQMRSEKTRRYRREFCSASPSVSAVSVHVHVAQLNTPSPVLIRRLMVHMCIRALWPLEWPETNTDVVRLSGHPDLIFTLQPQMRCSRRARTDNQTHWSVPNMTPHSVQPQLVIKPRPKILKPCEGTLGYPGTPIVDLVNQHIDGAYA